MSLESHLEIEESNRIAVSVMQALWGAISPNLRMVATFPHKPTIKFLFVLEKEDADDREEIDDFLTEFDALQDNGNYQVELEVQVTSEPLPWPVHPWFVIYRRKELAEQKLAE